MRVSFCRWHRLGSVGRDRQGEAKITGRKRRCTIGIEQEECQVVAEFQSAAELVCIRVNVVLVNAKQGHLHAKQSRLQCHAQRRLFLRLGGNTVNLHGNTVRQAWAIDTAKPSWQGTVAQHLLEAIHEIHSLWLALVVEEPHRRDMARLARQHCTSKSEHSPWASS